ncbi:Cytosolic endo-beta-N-acetylglucosaminidase [Phytophthora nicotianae]|uniref:Cytosolic endo-beta-N-acetylglucosaminidase n=1 Tax=Phytophthora nicotianae TaxID=4792 RepID=A0A0W8DFH0_PHYNI|nr:Cytosolic endo-beta-N-acetylglucosaminidase [Phytophthora nicotianae]
MDEIWDKSLEQQVISRAHRMGASQAVVVEQLWMRGSVESQMLKPHEADENQIKLEEKPEIASPTRVRAQQGDSPGRSPKKTNTGGGTMFNAPARSARGIVRTGIHEQQQKATRTPFFSANSTMF